MHIAISPDAVRPFAGDDPSELVEAVLAAILPPNEARVIRLRYGLRVCPCSLPTTARRLGIRITTTRRLEARALRRLREHAVALADAPASPTTTAESEGHDA